MKDFIKLTKSENQRDIKTTSNTHIHICKNTIRNAEINFPVLKPDYHP